MNAALTKLGLLALVIVGMLPNTSVGQNTYTWSGSTGGAWLTTTNWTGGPAGTFPGFYTAGAAANGNINDTAVFANTATNAGINMNTASGLFELGAISLTGATSIQIGNSSTTVNGILKLNGATVNSVPNTLLSATGANLTIANVNTGAGTQTMGLQLGIDNGIFNVAAGRFITVSSIISDGGLNFGFQVESGGVVSLSGANTYGGTVKVNNGGLSYVNTASKSAGSTTTVGANGVLALGVGGAGFFSAADVDSLWNNTFSGVTLDSSSGVGIDTTAGAFSYSTSQSTRFLTKVGANTLTLGANQTYLATTRVLAGTLQLGDGTTNYSVAGDILTNATVDFRIVGSSPITYAGLISGTGGVTKSGTGTLLLTGNNTFTGPLIVSGGVLLLNQAGANFGASTGTGPQMNWNGVSNVRMSAGIFNLGGTTPQLIFGATTYGSAELSGTAVWNYTHTDNTNAARFSMRKTFLLQTGGAINLNYTGGSGGILNGTEFILGNAGADRAVMYSSGGTVNFNTGILTGQALVIGDTLTANGGSDLTITGTADWTLTGTAGNVRITRAASQAGNLNLTNGGRLTTRLIIMGLGNAGRLNFDGGILRAGVSTPSFLTGLTSARIYAGGATIDTNNFDITIGQALLAPTGNVVQSIAVLTGGSGYLGAPIVTIIEGSGVTANTSATAIANYNASTGTVTSITITNPGSGFTAPTVSPLFGGTSGTAATLGPVVLTTATSGGLTKIGSGTLTLTGVNTYTGATTVTDGTLALSLGGSFAASPRIVVGTSAGSSAVFSGDSLTGGANFNGTQFTLVPGQTLAGSGTVNASVKGLAVPAGTTIAPGTSSVGTLSITGSAVIGGTYNFELAVAGTGSTSPVSNGASSPSLPHVNHDVLTISGSVDVTDMIVNITSLDTPGTGFDNTKYYSWTILTSSGLTGTPKPLGTVSGADFSNPGSGSFSIVTDSTTVYLNFSPVPEPRWILAIALLWIGIARYSRK